MHQRYVSNVLFIRRRSFVICSNFEDTGIQFDKRVAPNVRVFSDGTCEWFSPGGFSSPCPIDISWFPFDDQACSLVFQSWQYSGLKLNLTTAYDKVETQVMNGEWNFIGKYIHSLPAFKPLCNILYGRRLICYHPYLVVLVAAACCLDQVKNLTD